MLDFRFFRHAVLMLLLAIVIAGSRGLPLWGQEATPPHATDATAEPEAGNDIEADTGADTSDAGDTNDSATRIELSLDEAIRIALAENLALLMEERTMEQAREEIEIAAAVFDPVFASNYTSTKARSPTVDTLTGVRGGGPITTVTTNSFVAQHFDAGLSGTLTTGTTYSLTIVGDRGDNPDSSFFGLNPRLNSAVRGEITQPLLRNFGFDANLADLEKARNSDRIARYRHRRNVETTIAAVQNAYWDLVFAREDLVVKRESLAEAPVLLDINRQRVEVGSAKEIDVIDAEANIEEQKSGIIEAENQMMRAQDMLLDLLNYGGQLKGDDQRLARAGALYSELEVTPTSELDDSEYPVDLAQAVGEALASRVDIAETELDVLNSEIELERRRNQLLPELNVRGSWTQQGLGENLDKSLNSGDSGRFYDWTVGVFLEYPLGNRRARGLLRQSESDLYSKKLALEKIRNDITLEVVQAARDVSSTYQRVQTTRAARRLREEQLVGERERLREGLSTSYQVLQIQNDVLEAGTEVVRALVEYRHAITAFESAAGRIQPPKSRAEAP